MPNMGYTKIKSEERETIQNYLKSGMTYSEIEKITGRKYPAIRRIRDKMLEEGVISDNAVEPAEEVVKAPEPVDTVRDHRDDPRFGLHITIQMIANIIGHKTGWTYNADFDKKILTINTTEGVSFQMEFYVIEKFIDEMIDVSVEVEAMRKKFE